MNADIRKYIGVIRKNILSDYKGMYREASGPMAYPFISPGSAQYANHLWDWDSWLSNIALRQIVCETGSKAALKKAQPYERGCILNFLNWSKTTGCGFDGWIPFCVKQNKGVERPADIYSTNMHKPCLAQHAAFLVREDGGDAEWLREDMQVLQFFVNNYRNHHRHDCGIYYWQDDHAIGVDNDPCTLGRPPRSSGSIYLNALMYKELLALVYLLERLNLKETAAEYRQDADKLQAAIQEYCWDERDGFFYSVDFNLLSGPKHQWIHYSGSGQLRDWPCLVQRIGVWSGFMALWAGLATKEQAARVAKEHYLNKATFNAPYGVRSLSKMEKMFNLRASGNPSCWLGPIWGISNYMTFRGLANYGLNDDARELAEKTIRLFGRDVERFGAMHEYYEPENGEPVLNRHFQDWNYLVMNMIAWLEDSDPVVEF